VDAAHRYYTVDVREDPSSTAMSVLWRRFRCTSTAPGGCGDRRHLGAVQPAETQLLYDSCWRWRACVGGSTNAWSKMVEHDITLKCELEMHEEVGNVQPF